MKVMVTFLPDDGDEYLVLRSEINGSGVLNDRDRVSFNCKLETSLPLAINVEIIK